MASSSRASTRACWSAAQRKSATARRYSAWAASWRTRAATAGCTRVPRPGAERLVAGELGDCFLGAGIVDQVLAGRGGGDERGDERGRARPCLPPTPPARPSSTNPPPAPPSARRPPPRQTDHHAATSSTSSPARPSPGGVLHAPPSSP